MKHVLDASDKFIAGWMQQNAIQYLRYSLAVVFIWFGALKVIGFSPATELVTRTVYWLDPSWFVPLLGWWEIIIGVCFLHRKLIRAAIALLMPQMAGTFLPLVLLPGVVYQSGNVFLLTMEGQYIVKNLLLISAALVVGAGVRYRAVKSG